MPPSHLSSLPPPVLPHISPRLFLNPDSELRRANHTTPASHRGRLVNTIACAPVGGNFAAFAAGSGSFFRLHRQRRHLRSQACTRARTLLPVLEIHGGSDTDVPFAGGAGVGGTEPAIVDWLSRWATRNGGLFAGDVHHSRWACAGVEGRACCSIGRWMISVSAKRLLAVILRQPESPTTPSPTISPFFLLPPISSLPFFLPLLLLSASH
ncbi:hypothetical protein B0H14DRAFT_3891157 [Mycena olivaceomarginata]|nr:hypothetical protein B0H14DRAFT_3891157 [Mycena olivaceomarginata]